MSERQVLLGVEVPLAMPVIWTAIRVSAVAVVATATLGAIVGWGGLGRYVIDGFAQGDDVQIFIGGVSVALLAIATDLFFTVGERWVLPAGTRPRTGSRSRPHQRSERSARAGGDRLQRGKRGCQLTWRRHRPPAGAYRKENPCGAASAMVSLGRPWCWPSWPPPAGRGDATGHNRRPGLRR